MSTAIKNIEKILKSEFDMSQYVKLVREIFSTIKIVAPDKYRKEFSNFSSHVEGSYHVGSYVDPDNKKVAVFAVKLVQKSYVQNARSTQRSFAKKLIENGGCDAALIAFYTPNDNKWRLSFVVLDYEMKIENGKMKTEEKLTPARRYSYLVGDDEPCHTAISRFGRFIRDNNSQPTLAEMEEAFSVEAVTKEFFDLYCEKFYQLVEYLEGNVVFKEESERCGFSTEQFAKKLMGQIVFLYFLQKKGWLGVPVWSNKLSEKEYNRIFYCGTVSAAQRQTIQKYLPEIYIKKGNEYILRGLSALERIPDDVEKMIADNMPGDSNWGSGSKTFLRTWFEFSKIHEGNFYDKYLEPLFYDTLNKNRGELGYSTIIHCRVPFLSGGLFEPIDNYDWKNTQFDIPDEIFSNKKSDDDLAADGILDIFDRYNFTMSEDEPMEREVAIDPEMLGKVFENLLDVKDRKSKGAFYTPREIVHYMCQESLVNYITSNMDISEEAIRNFILYGDFYKDTDTEKTLKVTDANGNIHNEFDINRELNISPEIFDPKKGVNRVGEIDELLKKIRVADPAVGSGAFPLGMLNEIVRARQNISAYMATSMSTYNARLMYMNERSAHSLKKETIKNCIFAADIEPSAVDIAQLRLWLALVIDDEINPNAKSILDGHRNPLPLPNLECNIVCGNSLVDEFEGHKLIAQSKLLNTEREGEAFSWKQNEIEALIPRLVDAQNRLFECNDPEQKEQLKAEVDAIKNQMICTELSSLAPEQLRRYEESNKKSSRPFVLWQIDFARVFQEKGGFDVVIGNPPYVDSEEMTRSMPELRELYTTKYECAKGNWDLFVLFIEKGMNLLKREGVISYIVPNKLVAAPYTVALRNKIAENQVIEMRDYSNVTVFKTAAVYPVVFRVKKNGEKTPVSMDVMEDMNTISNHNLVDVEKFYADINWDKYFNSSEEALNIIEKMSKYPALKSLATVNGAATVGEAYIVKEFMYDDDNPDDNVKKFINTGGLDPYKSFWGSEYIRYLKGKYMNPVVKVSDIRDMSEKRLKECNEEKIIIGGMTKILECFYDKGEYLAGKSTTIVYGSDKLKFLIALLNSKLMTYYYRVFYNSMSLAGGFYRIGAPQIKELPIAIPDDEEIIIKVEEYVGRIQEAYENDGDDEIEGLKQEIDKIVYNIYQLSDEEIKIVEEGT